MQQSLRPYLTTGVAIAGAGIVVAVPAAPQPPDSGLRLLYSTDALGTAAFAGDTAPAGKPLADFVTGLLNGLGVGHLTVTDVINDVGLGHQTVGGLLTDVLNALDVGQKTPLALFDAMGGGSLTAGGVLTSLLNAVDVGQQTPVALFDAMGGASLTAGGVLTSLLNAFDLGQKTPEALFGATGIANVSLGSVLADLVTSMGMGNATLGGMLSDFGLANVTVQDMMNSLNYNGVDLGDVTVKTFLDNLGFGGLDSNEFLEATGGHDLPSYGGITLVKAVGDETLNKLLSAHDSAVGDVNLGSMLGAVGAEKVTALFQSGAGTTLSDLMNGAGLNGADLDTVIANAGLGNISVASLLSQAGLNNVDLDTLAGGTGGVSIASLLADAGLNKMDLDTLVGQTGLGGVTVASLLNGSSLGETDLDALVDKLLGTPAPAPLVSGPGQADTGDPTITGLADQAGVGDQPVASLLGGLFGGGTGADPTIAALLQHLDGVTVGGLLTGAVGNDTLTDLLGPTLNVTPASLVTSALDAAGHGTENLAGMFERILNQQFGGGIVSLGDLLTGMLNTASPGITLADALADANLSKVTIGDLLGATTFGNETFPQLLGTMGTESLKKLLHIDTADCSLFHTATGFDCSTHPDSFFGNRTVVQSLDHLDSTGSGLVHSGTPLGDVTLGQLLGATGIGNEQLTSVVSGLNLYTQLNTAFITLGLQGVQADTAVTDFFSGLGLDNLTLGSMLAGWGVNNLPLGTVIDRVGLDNLSLGPLLNDLGLNNLDVDTVLSRVLGGTTVDSLLGDLGLNNLDVGTVLGRLLTDLGLG